MEAYISLEMKEVSERQAQIMAALRKFPDMTDRELAHYLSYPDPNKVRPRRNELMKAGFVAESGKRQCKITGKTALTWYVTDKGVIHLES